MSLEHAPGAKPSCVSATGLCLFTSPPPSDLWFQYFQVGGYENYTNIVTQCVHTAWLFLEFQSPEWTNWPNLSEELSSTDFDINSIFVYAQLSKIFCKIYITLWNPQIPSKVSYLGRLPCSFGDTSLWQSSHNFWSAEFSDLPASAIISRHCLLTSLTSALAQFIYVSIWN